MLSLLTVGHRPAPLPFLRHSGLAVATRRTQGRLHDVKAAAGGPGTPHHNDSGGAGDGSRRQRGFDEEAQARARQAMDAEMLEALQRKLRIAERKLEEEQERATMLQRFRVPAPKRGVIGKSRYAKALRRAVMQASRDKSRRPVLLFGEPGLEKDNLAALIHFGSSNYAAPLVRLDCDRLDDDASDLYGAGMKKGLLYYLPLEGTLLLNNIHKAPKAVLPLLHATVEKASKASTDGGSSGGSPRIILVSETALPQFADLCTVIKVPPLRVRPSDVRELQAIFLRDIVRQRDLPRIRLTDEAVRQLESYSFPYNITELQTMLERAATQASGSGNVLTEEVFWAAKQPKDQLRYNLLKIPPLRRFLRSSLWPEDINHKFTVYAFAALVALLFIGPQDRAHNFGLNLFWCYWWPASFLIYPFLGRVWCSVCPFMIYGEIVQRWRMSQGAKLLKWPHEQMDKWGPWFLFWLFSAILVWEEVWDLPDTAYLSSWLLLLITAGAMIGSWFFERRIWCRHLCPIGGMNGLFAKLSMTELRARQGVCSSTCKTYHCFKGGPPEVPEGLETLGCPVYSHPAQLVDNRNCVLCMECLKACPHKSIEFRLRVPGVDLWTTHKPLLAEVCLMFMLLGSVYLHDSDDVLLQLGLDPDLFLGPQLLHILTSAVFLVLPGAIAWGVDSVWRLTLRQPANQLMPALGSAGAGVAGGAGGSGMGGNVGSSGASRPTTAKIRSTPVPLRSFIELAYGYLPLVWAGILAYYLDNAFEEAGLILPVAAATFGLDMPTLPTFVVDPLVTEFLQESTLVFGAALSLALTRKLGARPWRQLIPQCAIIVAFTAELYTLIIPN